LELKEVISMKGKVFVLIALLALAVLIAGCKEQAGEAVKGLSPQPDPPGVQVLRNELASVRADLDKLTDTVAVTNNKYDQLKAENNALKADLTKFTNAANGKFDMLKVKAGITGSDATKWDTFPIVTGYSWNNPVSASR
jgi:ABC-type oligopeptide transport system substrate-binding subunit